MTKQMTTDESPLGVNIGFLPAVTSPPTQMNVIVAIMNNAMQYKTELELDFIFLEVDQAIYCKVLQVLFKSQQEGSRLYDNLIVRMGGFHIILYILRTIYSRFKGSGIVELLAEAGVGGEGTIKAGMSGSNVKQGIRYYKLLFEALLRTKRDFIDSSQSTASSSNDKDETELPTQDEQDDPIIDSIDAVNDFHDTDTSGAHGAVFDRSQSTAAGSNDKDETELLTHGIL